MDLDSSLYDVAKGYYLDALNITKNDISANHDLAATNVIGNRLVTYTYPTGRGKYIGLFPFQLRNTVIGFRWNVFGFHGVYEYSHTTRIITKIFENLTDSDDIDILGFTENGKITSVNVYPRDEGDLLYFLDSLGRPTEMDIAIFKAGTYIPVTRAIIDKAKKPPLAPPNVVYDNDTSTRSNDLRNKLFRFKYRWIYDDFEKSTFSPISVVPLPVSILSDVYTNVITNNNVIQMTLNSGDKNAKAVEIGMSFVEKTNIWSDFQSVIVIDKSTLSFRSSTEVVTNDVGSEAIVSFKGSVAVDTVINIYLTLLSSGVQTLIATYTTVLGDTPTTVAAALVLSLISFGISTNQGSTGSQLYIFFNDSLYSFALVDIIATDVNVDNIDFPFSFYNDSTYPDIDINQSIQLFDYVPDYANAQDMPNGNVLAYGGITEGYNKDTTEDAIITVGTIAAGNGGSVGSLNAVLTRNNIVTQSGNNYQRMDYTFSGIPAVGTVIQLKVKRQSDHTEVVGATYTTIAADTANSVALGLFDTTANPGIFWYHPGNNIARFDIRHTIYEFMPNGTYSQLIITPPTTATATNSIATWPWSTSRNIARVYFDEKGKTNGVLYTDKVIFPAYAENGSQQPLLPFINYKINDIPPIWAYSMQFLFTKDGTDYKVWESNGVQIETEYIYFDVTSFTTNATKKPTTAQVDSYTFQDGDRLRIWRDTNIPGTVFADTFDSAIEGLVNTPTINGVVTPVGSLFIKIKNIAPFTGVIVTTKNYVLYIYRPTQQTANPANQVYYEFGSQWPIIDPTLSIRRHSGQVTDQVVGVTPAEYNFYEGDTYFRARTIAITDTGYATFNVIDRNFVDFYISAVNSIDGRPNLIDINARRQYYSTLVRFGQAYQANTNINGLNRFYAQNFDEYDYNFGDIIRIKARDRYLKIFQKFKIGVVPLYSQLTKDPNGNQISVVTDKLLNPIQYRIGNFGLIAPESLASWHFADYGCDTNTGDIWRDSNDGVLSISKLYKTDSWAIRELPLRTGDSKIYGTIDPKTDEYIIALEAYTVPVPFFNIEATGLNSVNNSGFTITSSAGFTVDWGDGTQDTFTAGVRHPTHVYSSPYTGEIRVSVADLSTITQMSATGTTLDIISVGAIGVTLQTSEVAKLTGLISLGFGSTGQGAFLDGIVSDLPTSLLHIGIISTNLNGTTLQLPRGLLTISIAGLNTISGDVSDLPTGLTYLLVYGLNTITGDVAGLPSGITTLAVHGSNTISGDVVDLPSVLTVLELTGNNVITGDVVGLPNGLTYIVVIGANTLSGNVSDLPPAQHISILGLNIISGNVSGIANASTFFQITGNNSISGDLAFLPVNIIHVIISSNLSTIDGYTNGVRTWHSTMSAVEVSPGAGGLSTTEVDNLLIELAAQVSTWSGDKRVYILGGSSPRSAASNAAVATLNGFGVVVNTN